MKKKFDCAIIGGGIAGVSATLYTRRAGLESFLFEPKAIGGQLLFMERVDNYPGLAAGTNGSVLAAQLAQTVKELGDGYIEDEVCGLTLADNHVVLRCLQEEYSARSVILATGASFRKLGVSREIELTGRGVSYCAICDGFFFRGKDVAVIGGGNSALEEALYLARLCRSVHLIHRRDSFRALDYLQAQVLKTANIVIHYQSVVHELLGTEVLEAIALSQEGNVDLKRLAVSGMFVAIGVQPVTGLVGGIIELDEQGFIVTDEFMKTSCDFIFSCGDCRRRPLRQLVTAASEGAIAAVSAYKYLKGSYISA